MLMLILLDIIELVHESITVATLFLVVTDKVPAVSVLEGLFMLVQVITYEVPTVSGV